VSNEPFERPVDVRLTEDFDTLNAAREHLALIQAESGDIIQSVQRYGAMIDVEGVATQLALNLLIDAVFPDERQQLDFQLTHAYSLRNAVMRMRDQVARARLEGKM